MMIKQYVKQAIYILKKNPLVTAVSMLGTALAIALVMVMTILFQIRTANYAPEVNRDRTLYLNAVRTTPRPGVNGVPNNSSASYEMVKKYLYPMKTPELVTTYTYSNKKHLSTSTKKLYGEYAVRGTDLNFWKYFQFRFVEGGSFDEGDYDSGLQVAVISNEMAQLLVGAESAVGKDVYINQKRYRISGVVDNVSRVCKETFADVWIPITSDANFFNASGDGITGVLKVSFLATKREDRASIKEELEQVIKKASDENNQYIISVRTANHIDTEFSRGRSEGIWKYAFKSTLIIMFLLLLPAINLTGITMNHMKERSSEMGIRKAFGATNGSLLRQVLMENLIITAIGALGGYILSYIFIYAGSDFLIARDTLLTAEMLFRPFSFFCAVFFCLLMNVMSAGLPAWRIAKRSITDSLHKHEF